MRHSEDYWELGLAKPGETRCTSPLKSKSGERCPRAALTGSPVCKMHGGLIPVVQAAAATRIGMSLDDAVKQLRGMLTDPQVESREKVKILHDLLDRGGLGATSKTLVGLVTVDPVERLFADILAGGLADPAAALPYEPSDYDRQVLRDDDYVAPRVRVIAGELAAPKAPHTVHVGEAPPTPKHIREALARLL